MMAIDYSQLKEAAKPGKATPRKDYSAWQKLPDESLLGYYKRLAAQRQGGILGTGGLLDAPTSTTDVVEAAEASTEEAVQQKQEQSSGDGSDTVTEYERYLQSDAYDAGFSFEDWKQTNKWDRLRGSDYAGQGLLYGIPHLIGKALDESGLKEELKGSGYSDEEAEALISDPTLGRATQQLGRTGQLATERYNYFEDNSQDSLGKVMGGVVDSIFGTNILGTKDTQSMMPLSPSVAGTGIDDGYKGLPLLSQGRTAQIQAAQRRDVADPLNDFGLDGLMRGSRQDPYEVANRTAREKAAAELAEQNRARIAAAEAQAEQSRLSMEAQQKAYDQQRASEAAAEAQRAAEAAEAARQAQASAEAQAEADRLARQAATQAELDRQAANYQSSYSSSSSSGGGYTYSRGSNYGTETSTGKVYSGRGGDPRQYGGGSSSSSSSSGSSRWCCSAMVQDGRWSEKREFARMTVWSLKKFAPKHSWWLQGYAKWGKWVAKNLVVKHEWAKDLMQHFYNYHVEGKPYTAKTLAAQAIIFPMAWVMGTFGKDVELGAPRLATKEELA